jgi:hypothetical protein
LAIYVYMCVCIYIYTIYKFCFSTTFLGYIFGRIPLSKYLISPLL